MMKHGQKKCDSLSRSGNHQEPTPFKNPKQNPEQKVSKIRTELDLDALLSKAASECEFSVQVDGASLLQELPLI